MITNAETTRILIADHLGFEKELLRKMAEAMGMTYEEQMRFFYGGRRAGETQAQREANMREINPRPQASSKPPASEDVTIEHDPDSGAYWVSLPRRGRLGDRRIFDGETGKPINISPTYRGPGEFKTIPEALAHFKRVATAFERLT